MGKDKKKRKKEKKHKKERKRKPSTSDSSESSSDEWVEKGSVDKSAALPVEIKAAPVDKEADWSSIFSGVSTADIRKAKEAEKLKDKVSMETKPGQSVRELNPYWKDGGTGLPPERDVKNSSLPFRKPSENQNHSGKSSLSSFSSDSKLSGKFRRPDDDNSDAGRFRVPHDEVSRSSGSRFRRPDDDSYHRRDRHSSRSSHHDGDDVSSSSKSGRFRKPDDDDDGRRTGRYDKHDDPRSNRLDVSDRRDKHSSRTGQNKDDFDKSRRGWRKNDAILSTQSAASSTSSIRESSIPLSENLTHDKSPSPPQQPKILTSDEFNELHAKILRAEIAGKMDVVAKLKKELENSTQEETEKTVILTQTDSRGYTRPVNRDDRGSGSKNKRKVQTHENSKRVRYFADDDDYSLQDMYEKEKYSSARDQEADFMNLMGKEMSRKDGSLALDDPFEETASIDNRNKKDKQQWDRAVRDQAKKEKIYDECKWCLGAKRMNQNLVIKTKQKVYLSCPPFQSLTEGHCLIIPHSHVPCSTQVDEDVWDEVMELRKELVRKLEKNDEDCVFFENASYLHKHPHMIIHCVPLPREIGDMAPIYFKKALLECESEWANNKKVVELAGRGVRKSVPKGLPYFFVDFGEQAGYAHVIEDQKLFPNNFAQEIIGGMLDLSHELWRKQKNVSEEELNKNVKYLRDLIEN